MHSVNIIQTAYLLTATLIAPTLAHGHHSNHYHHERDLNDFYARDAYALDHDDYYDLYSRELDDILEARYFSDDHLDHLHERELEEREAEPEENLMYDIEKRGAPVWRMCMACGTISTSTLTPKTCPKTRKYGTKPHPKGYKMKKVGPSRLAAIVKKYGTMDTSMVYKTPEGYQPPVAEPEPEEAAELDAGTPK